MKYSYLDRQIFSEMKLIICIAPLLSFSFIAHSQYKNGNDQFILNGKVTGQVGYVHLTYLNESGKYTNDSCALKDGNFEFKGQVSEPTMAFFYGNIKTRSMDDSNSTNFFIEPGMMTLHLKANDFKNAILHGSKTQDEYLELYKLEAPVRKEGEPLEAAYLKANNIYIAALKNKLSEKTLDSLKEICASIHDQFGPLQDKYKVIDVKYFDRHPNSYVTAFELRFYTFRLPLDMLQKFYDRMSSKLQQSNYGKAIAEEIEKIRGGTPGSMAKDFVAKDLNGDTLNLAYFMGKYILLDFWASWCVPCRHENPHLKQLYSKYKAQGLEFIGISDDDNNPDAWKKAVEKDSLPWNQVLRGLDMAKIRNNEKSENDISGLFGISEIPTQILIDKNGMIIGRFVGDPDALDKKLIEVFHN